MTTQDTALDDGMLTETHDRSRNKKWQTKNLALYNDMLRHMALKSEEEIAIREMAVDEDMRAK